MKTERSKYFISVPNDFIFSGCIMDKTNEEDDRNTNKKPNINKEI